MSKLIRLTFILSLLFSTAYAQRGERLEEVTIQKKLLPYTNPLSQIRQIDNPEEPVMKSPGVKDRLLLKKNPNIYRIHLEVIDAHLADDPVRVERHIEEAVENMQLLIDDFPEVKDNVRFRELYRTIMTEYKTFYNITDEINPAEGEIFAIHEEILAEIEEWDTERFDMPESVRFEKTDVPLVQNQQVTRHLMSYTMRRPEVMDRWLERWEKYFPMMREIFAEEGVPQELIHLSMIESGLVPTARSWAAAVGLWQFIRATGAMYGLEVNYWIDERRDPLKSTRAAARHLKDLYNIWGDWHLAMANYNISPRGLRRAINAAGGVEDYWAAYPYLPRETRGYVPGFIAATMIALNPVEFGFQREYGNEPWSYEVVEVAGLMPLDRLAEAAGVTTQVLREYNPELLRWATPPGESYPLKIPAGITSEFLAAYAEIPVDDLAGDVTTHVVSRGENLGQIARKYGTSVNALFSTNENLSTTIHPGQTIMVPIASGSMERIAADRPSNAPSTSSSSSSRQTRQQVQAPANTTPVTYSVKSGDTVGHIAEWFDVQSWQIRAWNGIGNIIRAGQNLTVHVPSNRADFYRSLESLTFSQKQDLKRRQGQGENIYTLASSDGGPSSEGGGSRVTYTVKRNDTLIDIASSFGVSVAEIQRLNDLRGTRIYAGQTLEIQTSR